jgi:hypothetical protein
MRFSEVNHLLNGSSMQYICIYLAINNVDFEIQIVQDIYANVKNRPSLLIWLSVQIFSWENVKRKDILPYFMLQNATINKRAKNLANFQVARKNILIGAFVNFLNSGD